MTVNDPSDPRSAETEDWTGSAARKNRGVRFSDPEWEEVREAARTDGLTPAEFVRERVLGLVRSPATPAADPGPADLAPLIERTFRYTYILATAMRDDMINAGREAEVEALVKQARELQDSLLGRPPAPNREPTE